MLQDAVDYVRSTARSEEACAKVGMYKVVIQQALVNGNADLSRELLQEIKERGMTWDNEMWGLQLEAAVRHQCWFESRSQSAVGSTHFFCFCTLDTLTPFVKAFSDCFG